ncbi:MAG: PASTA domain-containing protein [Thermoleophilia bacterium]|nr:PASTA domain-containing protein [Thermoleophilia bacterium]
MELGRIASARLARLALAVALGAAATAGATWAAAHGVPATQPEPTAPTEAAPAPLVVPDVRRLAFVFAKGALEDAGFAWRVRGPVHGYPANTVVAQSPPPGAAVVDTGAPLVTLTLKRNLAYPQAGEPEDASPYAATAVKAAAAGRDRSARRLASSGARLLP